MRKFLLFIFISLVCLGKVHATPIMGITAVSKNGQVFITWTNLNITGVEYIVYKSATPIIHGNQLISAQNLGYVHDSSAVNKRFSQITGVETYFKIDSASTPLLANQGLFVATSTVNGSFYYAIATSTGNDIDTTIITGMNSLTTPVTESVSSPESVWQRSYVEGSNLTQIYVQFVSTVTSSIYPRMTNQGSFPFNFAISPPSASSLTSHPLELRLHGGGGNFLEVMSSVFDTGAYGLGLDDWLPNDGDFSSAWYGYYENYDVYSNINPVPDTGITIAFTLQREIWTLNWVERHYPIDTTRLYISGSSMGASGALWLAMYIPGKIAVVGVDVPKFDLGFENDPNSGSAFNAGTVDRSEVDTFLGTVSSNLPCDLGYNTYDFLNNDYMVYANRNNSLPIIFTQSGRNDSLTGWAEKIPFYDSVNANNAGGFYFWDTRGHTNNGRTWNSVPNPYRYSTALSYPAFSNCSINNNPGDGYKNNGDSVGTINGYLNWNDPIIDEPYIWQVKLYINNISSAKGTFVGPDSCTVEITPKRLQQFGATIGDSIDWVNYASDDNTVIQKGGFIYYGGQINIPGVKIYKATNTLELYIPARTSVISPITTLNYAVNLFPDPSPGNVELSMQIKQPIDGLTIRLINITGQVMRFWSYPKVGSWITTNYDLSDLPKGEYFIQFICDKFTTTRKLVLQ